MRPIESEGRKADDWRMMMREEKGERKLRILDLGKIFIWLSHPHRGLPFSRDMEPIHFWGRLSFSQCLRLLKLPIVPRQVSPCFFPRIYFFPSTWRLICLPNKPRLRSDLDFHDPFIKNKNCSTPVLTLHPHFWVLSLLQIIYMPPPLRKQSTNKVGIMMWFWQKLRLQWISIHTCVHQPKTQGTLKISPFKY